VSKLIQGLRILSISAIFFSITSCSTEIGSKPWCEDMKEKPKGEWTLDETGNYTKHCLFK